MIKIMIMINIDYYNRLDFKVRKIELKLEDEKNMIWNEKSNKMRENSTVHTYCTTKLSDMNYFK
jgi:hypothetical protein